jgi:hypothetical protein
MYLSTEKRDTNNNAAKHAGTGYLQEQTIQVSLKQCNQATILVSLF